MQGQQNNGPGDLLSMRQSFNVLAFVCLCHATAITPFLRKNFGSEALGFNGLAAFILLLLMAGMAGPPGVLYLVLWLIMLMFHRAGTWSNYWRGRHFHSRYAGDSWLSGMVFKSYENQRKLDAGICLFAGAGLCCVSEILGGFVMFGFVSMLVIQAIEMRMDAVRLQQMRDSQIEAAFYNQQFRER